MQYKKRIIASISLLAIIIAVMTIKINNTSNANINDNITRNLTFRDMGGNILHIKSQPKNIGFFFPGSPLIYYSISNKTDNMAYIIKYMYDTLKYAQYMNLIPQFAKLQYASFKHGGLPSIEEMVHRNIDLSIFGTWTKKFYKKVQAVGIHVIAWNCCDYRNNQYRFRNAGYMTGKVDRAQEIIEFQNNIYKNLEDAFKDMPESKRKTGLHIGNLMKDSITKLIMYENMRIGGLRLPDRKNQPDAMKNKKNYKITISIEEFLLANPEVLLITGWATEIPQNVYDIKHFQSIKAVKNKMVLKAPMFAASINEPLYPLKWEWLSLILYPNKFKDKYKEYGGFRNKVKAMYKKMYNLHVTEDQLDRILLLKENGQTKGYKKLFGRN